MRESSRWRNDYSRQGFLMLPHPLTNFEIQKYYQNEPKFKGLLKFIKIYKEWSICNKSQ